MSEVAQSCPTLCDPMDYSLPGSSAHGIFKAIVLEWVAISFSSGSSQPRDRTGVSHIVDRHFTIWAIREDKAVVHVIKLVSFRWLWFSVCLQCKRPVCRPWVGKIHWRKEWLPTPVFFPGQFHGRWSLVDYSPWSFKESDTEWITNTHSRVSDWQEAKKCFTFTHAIPRIATWWCQMAYVCLFSTGKISRNFFFPFLYLQGYQGVFFSLLFINIFSQSLIHKKVLNGKSENLESVVNWGENKGERK